MSNSVLERFWSKVDRSGGPEACWPWTAYVAPDAGYGQFWDGSRLVKAHRFAAGAVMHPGDVDHTCHNASACAGGVDCPHRRCCNPAHLEPTTHAENVRRGRSGAREAARTTCPRGHSYADPDNTYINPRGSRKCRACRRISQSAYYARKVAA